MLTDFFKVKLFNIADNSFYFLPEMSSDIKTIFQFLCRGGISLHLFHSRKLGCHISDRQDLVIHNNKTSVLLNKEHFILEESKVYTSYPLEDLSFYKSLILLHKNISS